MMSHNPAGVRLSRRYQCEFCEELADSTASRFRGIYGPDISSRIVARQGAFVAMPTIGQLMMGSLLALPVPHFETLAQMPQNMRSEFGRFVGQLARRIKSLGEPVFLEHGAESWTGGGCGVYHAHMHIVPVPERIGAAEVLPRVSGIARSLPAAWSRLQRTGEYLVFQDAHSQVAFLDLSRQRTPEVASQHFRRVLVERFRLAKDADWRAYTSHEPLLIKTLEWFGVQSVPLS